ncbi:MAG: dynamin family protein [Pseudomonadota bacterium]
MTHQVRFDPADLRAAFSRALDDFMEPFTTPEARAVLGNDHLPGLRRQLADARARLDRDFVLLVLGDFKRGKSTLINALLERELLPSDVTPETVSINQVAWGSSIGVEAVLENGGKVTLGMDDLPSARLQRVQGELPAPVDHLLIHAPAPWLRGLRIVDTPGLGDLMQRFEARIQAFLPVADAVIYLVSALSPLSETERSFLQAHIRPQGYPRLLFVVNMLDAPASAEEGERVLEAVRTKIHRDFPGAGVMGLSALDELCRIEGLPRPVPEREEELARRFEELRDYLRTSVLLDRELVHVARSLGYARASVLDQRVSLDRLVRALGASQEALDAAIDAREDQHSALHERIRLRKEAVRKRIEGLSSEATRWMDGFLDRLRDGAVAGLEKVPYGDVQRYFPFFFTERVREALTHCFDAHQPVILAELEKAGQDLQRALSEGPTSLDRSLSTAGFEATRWHMSDNFYLLGPLGSVARLVFVDGLGRLFRVSSSEKAEPSGRSALFRRQVEATFPEVRRSAVEEIRAIYVELARRIDLELDSGVRAELEATLQTLRQAREIRGRELDAGASVERLIAGLTQHTDATLGALDGLRERLEQSSVVDIALP